MGKSGKLLRAREALSHQLRDSQLGTCRCAGDLLITSEHWNLGPNGSHLSAGRLASR
jgi:hypothetical protein